MSTPPADRRSAALVEGPSREDKMMVVDVTAERTFIHGRPRVLFDVAGYAMTSPTRSYDVTPEGSFVMLARGEDGPDPVIQMQLVLSWFEELTRRVPTD